MTPWELTLELGPALTEGINAPLGIILYPKHRSLVNPDLTVHSGSVLELPVKPSVMVFNLRTPGT